MMSIILDTNALLRFLLNDIPEQKIACEQLLNQAKRKEIKLSIAQASIFELDFILRKYYLCEKSIVLEQLKPLITTNYIDIESRAIFNKALVFYQKESLSFVDCFLAAKAKSEGAELFTFDQKLQRLQNSIVS